MPLSFSLLAVEPLRANLTRLLDADLATVGIVELGLEFKLELELEFVF